MIYLIHGDDIYHIEKKFTQIISEIQSNNSSYEIINCNLDEIKINEIELDNSTDLFGGKKLFVLKNFSNLSDNDQEKLASQIFSISSENELELIIVEKLKLSLQDALIKNLSKIKSKSINYFELPKWENQKQEVYPKFIQEYLSTNHFSFSPDLPYKLYKLLGSDFFIIESELQKLKYIDFGTKELTLEICEKYLVSTHGSIIFNFINMIFDKNCDFTVIKEELSMQLRDPTSFMLIVSLINRELRIRYLKNNEISLKILYNLLLDIDIDYKSGGNPEFLLLKFITEVRKQENEIE